MPETILRTKIFIPPLRPNLVPRPRLSERLNQGLQLGHKLALISAPAGFGKTTLVSEWIAGKQRPAAWLSLDEGDNDPARFLTYLIAALQTLALSNAEGLALRKVEGIVPAIGEGLLALLQCPQQLPTESILITLINEITAISDDFILVLDDYHLIDAQSVDTALTFLLEHLPPQMHLVITTREDPNLPLARLRVRGQLTELRVADLRFYPAEAAELLNQMMGLNLSADEIAALENRTEGWIAGLQLAALSMQGHKDVDGFIKTFTGSHHFVLDYLVEEVLHQQSESIQTFLMRTSILDRLCGPLCDAILLDPSVSGQETLAYLERANLFVVPLDSERRWYRYHHLFADLLRQRLHHTVTSSSAAERAGDLHSRASIWYEENGLEIEAFQHAAAANDVGRAERLIEGERMPLYYRGGVAPVLNWLESLPTTVLDARPSLWVMYAWTLWIAHQNSRIEDKLQAAEAALQGVEPSDKTQDLVGQIAALKAMLAANQALADTIISESHTALNCLHPDNLPVRTAVTRTLGYAYHIQGDRAAAGQAYAEAISMSEVSGNIFINILATTGLGIIQETENQSYLAAESYRRVLELVGEPQPVACEAYLGLARIYYEWNELDAAQAHGQQSLELAQYIEGIDSFVGSELFLARLKLAQGDVAGTNALLAKALQSARQHNFEYQIQEIAAVQLLVLLQQGDLAAAAHLAEKHELPISQARVHLAQRDASAALEVLEPMRQKMEEMRWPDERLKIMVLQALAQQAHGAEEEALQILGEALALAEPEGFIRLFVDEGSPMAQLLSTAATRGMMPLYTRKLLAAFAAEKQKSTAESLRPTSPSAQFLIEPLSQRELEILQLVAQGLSNREISERLYLALSTVKGHNRIIFSKLQVQRRTEAVARARELGLL